MTSVLVIDDDAQFRRMLRSTLERSGHEVIEAEDGPQGIAAFVARPTSIAVVDLYMPEQSGWETIRELHGLASDLAFVVVTGGGAIEAVAKGGVSTLELLRASDAVRVLRKPFERDALITAIDSLLAARRARATGT